jgi:hypothetical protein
MSDASKPVRTNRQRLPASLPDAKIRAVTAATAESSGITNDPAVKSKTHRATIHNSEHAAYHLDGIAATSLPQLCHLLIRAGYDPDDAVECYRPGGEAWDLRATSLRRAATLLKDGPKGSEPSGDANANGRASRSRAEASKQPSRAFGRDAFAWDGLRLRLRASRRIVAALLRDQLFPNLCRVRVGPDYVSDIINLTRAKEAAELHAVRMLCTENAVNAARSRRRLVAS